VLDSTQNVFDLTPTKLHVCIFKRAFHGKRGNWCVEPLAGELLVPQDIYSFVGDGSNTEDPLRLLGLHPAALFAAVKGGKRDPGGSGKLDAGQSHGLVEFFEMPERKALFQMIQDCRIASGANPG
jgi:hypothetical protein